MFRYYRPMAHDQRQKLAELVRTRGEDFAGLSRLIGRNPAYIQQFIKRGVPRKLDEGDRRTLARYFEVDDEVLGGPSPAAAPVRMVAVPRLEIGASAGPGALAGDESARSHIGFEQGWLRRLCRGASPDLSIVQVQGDSMEPGLADGDDILVDRGDAADRLRDGVYVLRRGDALMVKRLTVHPSGAAVTIKSDNPAYRDFPDVPLAELAIIGRVIWAGGRVR